MNRRRFLLLLFFIFFTFRVFASEIVSEIVWDSPLPQSDFSRLIKIKKGEPLSIKKVRRTVKLLYATKKFEKIDISSEKAGDGKVKIIIKGEPQLIIEDIKIYGNHHITDRELKLASGIGLNALYSENDFLRIREEIIYYYRENGWFSVAVGIGSTRLSETTVKITIRIDEGTQEKFKKFKINGNFNKTEYKKLIFDLESSFKGRPYTDKNVTEIEYAVIDRYKKEGFLNIAVTSDKRKDGLLILNIRKGSHFSVNVEGAYWFSPDTITKVVKEIPNYHFDTASIRKKLEILYHSYGFHDAEITPEIQEKTDSAGTESTINIKIKENERRFINKIVLNGTTNERNIKIVTERLSDFIADRIEEENFPLIMINRTHTGGGYIDTDGSRERTLKDSKEDKVGKPDSPHAIPRAYLDEIREMTEKIYQNGGYTEVEVSNVAIHDNGGKLVLDIDVTENTQYFLAGIDAFTGNAELDKALKKKLKMSRTLPYNERIVQAYQKRISEFLTDKGYIFHLVTHEEKIDGNKVFLTFNVEYLFKVKITEVVIAGNYLTTSWVVRHILRIDPGDVLDGDSFQYSRRNMLQTGIFQSVDIDFIDPEFPNDEKDLVVTVSESERFKVSPSVGISSDEGVRFIGSFEWKNMVKSGVSSKISLKVSRKIELFMNERFRKYYDNDFTSWQRTERKVNLTFLFQDTYIPKVPLSAQIDAFHIHDIRSNGGLPYMIDKNGLYFSIFRRFSNRYYISTGFELAYRYEKDYEVSDEGDVSYEILQRLVISPEIRGYIDFRDSVFFPTKGWKLSLRYQNTSSVAGDKNQYSLFEGGLALYIPLHYRTNFAGDRVSTDRLIFHSYLASAFLLPHSGELSSDDVLKLGGNTTMRGFYTNELLPNDMNDEMAEGKFYMFIRNELRVKLITDLYLLGFVDIGNLWEEAEHVGEGDLFRYSSGGGLLYASPIGSITAQAGFNLKPHEGENTWTIHVFLSTM